MTIANVALTDTFDVWRVRTNQLITLYDETNQLARSSYNATNLAVVTSSNIAANIISGNSAVYNTIYASTNTIAYNVITLSLTKFYDTANASYDQSNAALVTSNTALIRSNTALVTANLAYDTANNFVANASNSVAEVLASNTIIQNIVNTTANTIVSNFLANVSFTYIGNVANAAFEKANTGDITGVAAFDQANLAFAKANVGTGGYFAGNNGYIGENIGKGDIFRINSNTFTGNIVFAAGENASATGPLYMDPSAMIEIQTGARVVIL